MALYRACYLGNSRLPNAGACLFLTYNRALAKDVDRKLKAMGMSNVKATTYHSFLTTVLGAQKREETEYVNVFFKILFLDMVPLASASIKRILIGICRFELFRLVMACDT